VELVFVGHGSQKVGCGGSCGPVQTLGDQIRQVLGGVSLAYGDQLQGNFIDLDEPKTIEHPLAKQCHVNNYNLPVLFIDGQPRFQGVIPLTALKAIFDESGLQPRT
jgi:hypothetical protein